MRYTISFRGQLFTYDVPSVGSAGGHEVLECLRGGVDRGSTVILRRNAVEACQTVSTELQVFSPSHG